MRSPSTRPAASIPTAWPSFSNANRMPRSSQLGTAVFRNPCDPGLGDGGRLPVRPRAHEARCRRSRGGTRSAIRAQRRSRCATSSHRTSVRPISPRAWVPPGCRPTSSRPLRPRSWAREVRIWHTVEIASWSVEGSGVRRARPPARPNGARSRRHAGLLLHDALNSATPQIYDTVIEDGVERRVLNVEATEAAKEKLAQDQDRLHPMGLDRPRPRRPAGADLQRPVQQSRAAAFRRPPPDPARAPATSSGSTSTRSGSSGASSAAGSTYIAHTVGAGKTFSIAAAIMEQKRLGSDHQGDAGRARPLPGPGSRASSCSSTRPPASWSPTRPTSSRRSVRGSSRAPRRRTGTRSSSPTRPSASSRCRAAFERQMIEDQIAMHEALRLRADDDDRTTRKRIEAMKETALRAAGELEGPPRRHGDDRGDRHRPGHRRRGPGVPKALLRDQPRQPEGRRSGRARSAPGTCS